MLIGYDKVASKLFLIAGIYFLATTFSSLAQAEELSECAAKYLEKKDKNELAGQSWQDFYAACKSPASEKKTSYQGVKSEDALAFCATDYHNTKSENALNGQSWSDFYKSCREAIAAAETAPVAKEAPISDVKTPAPVKEEQANPEKTLAPNSATVEKKPESQPEGGEKKETKPAGTVKKKVKKTPPAKLEQ
ncbi:MAG: hypothetical protein ACKOPC_02540 [Methylocystis sp.]